MGLPFDHCGADLIRPALGGLSGCVIQQPTFAGGLVRQQPARLARLLGFVDRERDAIGVVYNGLLFLLFKHTQPRTEFLRSARAEVASICFNGGVLTVTRVKTPRNPRKAVAGVAGLEPGPIFAPVHK